MARVKTWTLTVTVSQKSWCRQEKIEINCLNSNSKSCHKKDPPPSQKYEQKTIEFGVFIDKWLYYQMGVSIS